MFLSASARFAAASMAASSGVTVGFLVYICVEKKLSLKLLLHVSHLTISSNICSVHNMSLVHMPFFSAL